MATSCVNHVRFARQIAIMCAIGALFFCLVYWLKPEVGGDFGSQILALNRRLTAGPLAKPNAAEQPSLKPWWFRRHPTNRVHVDKVNERLAALGGMPFYSTAPSTSEARTTHKAAVDQVAPKRASVPRTQHAIDVDKVNERLAALGGMPFYSTAPSTSEARTMHRAAGDQVEPKRTSVPGTKHAVEQTVAVEVADPGIKQLSPLKARSKDIYDLQSGQILLLSKWDNQAEDLQMESDLLQTIQKAGIRVVPHKLIKTTNPRTGTVVKGMIQERLDGTFLHPSTASVMIGNDSGSTENMISSLAATPKAARNLKNDLANIRRARDSGLTIDDLQGFVQSDGHFIVIDPLGIILPRGKYVGNVGHFAFKGDSE